MEDKQINKILLGELDRTINESYEDEDMMIYFDYRKFAEISNGRIWKHAFTHEFVFFSEGSRKKAYVTKKGEISIYENNKKKILGNVNDCEWKDFDCLKGENK